jgi:hypothetical protein
MIHSGPWSAEALPAGSVIATPHPISRPVWIDACAERLAQLNPARDRAGFASHAAELWTEVGRYDPGMAAEMEWEAGTFDD